MSLSPQGWYLAENGNSLGPMSLEELRSRLEPGSMVYGPQAASWIAAEKVPGLVAPSGGVAAPPPPPVTQMGSDEIDYEISGDDLQMVEVTLDPGEMVIAEAGSMLYMTPGIQMETRFGDPGKQGGGMMDKLMQAGKRAITGESLFLTTFTCVSQQREQVAFAAPYPGKILAMHLDQLGGDLICQKDSFLAAARGTDVGIAFQKKLGAGLFGGEGFILQRLRGDGIALVHAGGHLKKMELAAGQTLRLDTGCLVAFQPSVTYDIQLAGGVKTALFGGEGIFLATLTGPGTIWTQSLPFSRLANRIVGSFADGKGEGSVLGSLSRAFEQ